MSLSLEAKKSVVAEMSTHIVDAQVVIVAEYRGLAVGEMTTLRAKTRAAGAHLRVIKNTLARRAIENSPFAGVSEHLVGPVAVAVSKDPVALAKTLHEFAKGNNKLVIRAGALANFPMSAKDVESLATMPSREQLLAKLLGTMQAPIVRLVRVLNEVPAKLVRGLAAVRDRKEQEA